MDTSQFNATTQGKAKLTKMKPKSKAYKHIENMMYGLWQKDESKIGVGRDAKNLDHDAIQIVKIERLKNDHLAKKCMSYKNKVPRCKTKKGKKERYPDIEKLSSRPVTTDTFFQHNFPLPRKTTNEYYLLHGCYSDAAKGILLNGFDPKRTGKKAMFGQGVYFAEKPNKADQYAGKSIFVYVFILFKCDFFIYTYFSSNIRSI